MKNAVNYISSLKYQTAVLDLIESYAAYFDQQETAEYVYVANKTENSIDVIIGSEKFTIVSNIQTRGKIVFDVYGWEFDISSLTRYTGKKIENLTMVKDGVSLCFKTNQLDYDNHDFIQIVDLSKPYEPKIMERFFDQLEKYIDKKNNPERLKAY